MAKKKVEMNQEEPIKRIYRSKEDKMIAGVCGGIAEYYSIDPVWIRLIAVILFFLNGVGLLAYIVLWILMPENPHQKSGKKTVVEERVDVIKERNKNIRENNNDTNFFLGTILIIIGILFLIKNVLGWFNTQIFWGSLIIIIGVIFLLRK